MDCSWAHSTGGKPLLPFRIVVSRRKTSSRCRRVLSHRCFTFRSRFVTIDHRYHYVSMTARGVKNRMVDWHSIVFSVLVPRPALAGYAQSYLCCRSVTSGWPTISQKRPLLSSCGNHPGLTLLLSEEYFFVAEPAEGTKRR